jgi:chromosome segregation ATPase
MSITTNDMLTAILQLVSDPDKVKANIVALQDKIAEHKDALEKNLSAKESAEARIMAAELREKNAKGAEDVADTKQQELDAKEKSLLEREAALENAQNEHNARVSDLSSSVNTHQSNVASLQDDRSMFDRLVAAKKAEIEEIKNNALEAEARAIAHEQYAAAASAKLKNKMDEFAAALKG